MQTLKLEKNRGFLVAGAGAVVALFAFLYLPFVSVAIVSPNSSPVSYNTTEAASFQGAIWLEGLLALALLVLAVMLIYRQNPFGSTRTPVVNQLRTGILLIGSGGILSIIVQFFVSLSIGNAFQQRYLGSPISATTGYDVGSWLYLLGMVAVIIGAVLAYRKIGTVSTLAVSPYQSPDSMLSSPYQLPPSSPYDASYNGQHPYQQNLVAPSSPYEAVPGQQPQWYAPDPQAQQAPSPYQIPNSSQPPQQWPPNYPS